jgi:hypothetical protein
MNKTIILVLVIAGLGFFGYNYFLGGEKESDVTINSGASSGGLSTSEIINRLNRVSKIELNANATIFSGNPATNYNFDRLSYFERKLPESNTGRPNPFLPVNSWIVASDDDILDIKPSTSSVENSN